MDVDLANFDDAVALLETHLPRAAFVALDLEMTGIFGPPDTQVKGGDVPQVQYAKGRAVVQQPYNIVQVGVCLFEELSPGHFDARPLNFFVFPRPISERDADGKQVKVDDHFIGLSASSMTFLATNGLDFNRWIHKGISYVRGEGEEELLRLLPGASKEGDKGGGPNKGGKGSKDKPEPSKPEDVKVVSETMQKVADFAASGEREMKLPNLNAFLALIIRNKIAESHPHLAVEKRSNPTNPNWQERWVTTFTDEDRASKEEELRRRVMTHIGFRRVWNLLKSHKRPIVLHNGFFDLLFMYSAFEAVLLYVFDDFKAGLRSFFPHIFDTKVLAEAAVLAGTLGNGRSSLGELAEALSAKLQAAVVDVEVGDGAAGASVAGSVTFALPEGFAKYTEASGNGSGEFHTAGYDAWQTGRVFAYFRAHLGDMKILDFKHRVFLMFSAFELNIEENVDRLLKEGVARHLYDIDTTALNQRGLVELLKPVLEDGKRKYAIRWCDSRSLLLVIHGSEDTASESPGRDALERVLDGLLAPQVEQSRLQFRQLSEHLERVAKAASIEEERAAGAAAGPSAKRRRTG